MYARVSFYEMGSASSEDAVRAFEQARAAVEQMQGSEGGMLLVSPEGGKAMTITLWENEEAVQASSEAADRVRGDAAQTFGGSIESVEIYEVPMHESFGR